MSPRSARPAAAADVFGARMCREHNDVNVLCLGARVTDQPLALDILRMWLATEFAGGRHARRVDKIGLVERLRVEDGAGRPGWAVGDGASGPR